MREILFRGKTNLGKWIEGDLLNYLGCGKVHVAQNYKGAGGQEVIPETVGQYTGLRDSSDRKIFEGDILKTVNRFTHLCRIGDVNWGNGCFCVRGTGKNNPAIDIVFNECAVEIVGNIHDNPELLRKE